MKIVKTAYDADRSTILYKIEDITNWDLKMLHAILLSEKARATLCHDQYRGSVDLLTELDKLYPGPDEH